MIIIIIIIIIMLDFSGFTSAQHSILITLVNHFYIHIIIILFFLWMSQNSVVGLPTRLRAGRSRIRCLIPVRHKRVPFLPVIQPPISENWRLHLRG